MTVTALATTMAPIHVIITTMKQQEGAVTRDHSGFSTATTAMRGNITKSNSRKLQQWTYMNGNVSETGDWLKQTFLDALYRPSWVIAATSTLQQSHPKDVLPS
jgi:hypothetical protein